MEHDKSYNLRNNSVYIEPRCKLELYKQSFFFVLIIYAELSTN